MSFSPWLPFSRLFPQLFLPSSKTAGLSRAMIPLFFPFFFLTFLTFSVKAPFSAPMLSIFPILLFFPPAEIHRATGVVAAIAFFSLFLDHLLPPPRSRDARLESRAQAAFPIPLRSIGGGASLSRGRPPPSCFFSFFFPLYESSNRLAFPFSDLPPPGSYLAVRVPRHCRFVSFCLGHAFPRRRLSISNLNRPGAQSPA